MDLIAEALVPQAFHNSNFALAKHTPPFKAAPMRIVYNAFSYLEGVIIQGMISGFLYSRV